MKQQIVVVAWVNKYNLSIYMYMLCMGETSTKYMYNSQQEHRKGCKLLPKTLQLPSQNFPVFVLRALHKMFKPTKGVGDTCIRATCIFPLPKRILILYIRIPYQVWDNDNCVRVYFPLTLWKLTEYYSIDIQQWQQEEKENLSCQTANWIPISRYIHSCTKERYAQFNLLHVHVAT